MKRDKLFFNLMCYGWLAVLLLGMNFVLQFVSLDILLFAVVFFCLIDLVMGKVGLPLKVLVSLLIVHRNFYVGSFFSSRWLTWLGEDLAQDWDFLLQQGWLNPSPVTGLVLTLLLTIIVQGLYFVFLTRRKGALWLLFLGAALLSGISLANQVNAMFWLFLYVVIGLLIVATTRLQVEINLNLRKWISVLLVWVLCLTSIAWALPRPDVDWNDWYSRIQEKWDQWRTRDNESENGKSQTSVRKQRTGYSVYDGALGAPLQPDYTRIMMVESPMPVYLRGESLSHYSGSGWRKTLEQNTSSFVDLSPANIQGEVITVTVQAVEHFPGSRNSLLFVPRYLVDISLPQGAALRVQGSENDYGDYQFRANGGIAAGEKYTMQVLIPDDDPELLRQATWNQAESRYLELGNSVTGRVVALAEEITADADNAYDMAVALVEYLQSNYRYSLQVESVPPRVDFVDYFLFKMDRGYCVHFSTAFVILARSVGLPARWVKGYSPGNRLKGNTFSVQNSHAHAWAEIWFDDYGWVPFEPTSSSSSTNSPQPPGSDRPNLPAEPDPDPGDPGTPATPNPLKPTHSGAGESPWMGWLSVGSIAVLLALFALAVVGISRRPRGNQIGYLYNGLQQRLRFFGWQRFVWETPREHLARVGSQLPKRKALARLVSMLEKALYANSTDVTSKQFRRLARPLSFWCLAWHRLLRR